MQFDSTLSISTGNSRKASFWQGQDLYWSEFIERLSKPLRTHEAFAEYKALPKPKQDELKDVGGFVGGTLINGRRRNEAAGQRFLVTLDADSIEPGGTQRVINMVSGLGCAYVIYSTRKHEGAAPRLRIIFPLDIPCGPEEYEAVARKLASFIDINIFDPTTFEPVRMMYWPSCSRDSEYVFIYEDKPFLSVKGMLGLYHDWRNVEEWPQVPGAARIRDRSARKQGDPLLKTGIVGAFCKSYGIEEAMDEFIPGVYEPCGNGRYTYTGGSTVGGAVLYEEKFLYSHHATDPCSGKLCNAFDMVRLHLFGDEDAEALPDTPTHRLPSYGKMCAFLSERPEIKQLVITERMAGAQEAFGMQRAPAEAYDPSWINKLKVNPNSGNPVSVPYNMKLIIENDPAVAGRFYLDEFAGRIYVTGALPWDPDFRTPRIWKDEDDAGLRNYFSDVYSITGKEKIADSLAEVIQKWKCHPLKNYLSGLVWDGVPRVDTLLSDYFGAEDTAYCRAAIRKCLVAAVARVFRPGVKFDCMLILSGAQGLGKSTFWNRLGLNWYSDSLNTFEGKEASELLQGYWIIEVSELAGLNRAEMNTIKGFLSKQEDVYRAPYGRRTVPHPRSCILVGTTNDSEFLRDKTGNRRFWPIDLGKQSPVKNIWRDLHTEVGQIWAEAVEYFKRAEPLYMDTGLEDLAAAAQAEHQESDPREGLILSFLDSLVPEDWNRRDEENRRTFYMNLTANRQLCRVKRDRICAVELWIECFHQDKGRMKNSDAREINSILRRLPDWEELKTPRNTAAYGKQRIFVNKVLYKDGLQN